VLRRLDVRGSGFGKLLVRPERCHFFYDYDRQYRQVRLVLQDLRTALDAKKQGANCLGALHTAGALVPRHCDDVDVIVLQVMGTRLWRVEPNSDPSQGLLDPVRWPRRLAGGWSAEFGAKSRTYALAPGSAFYVPRGWWHETQSPATSFALTFAFKRKRGPR
jgi:ribosomal protein L16 Arg81 hydroxylase